MSIFKHSPDNLARNWMILLLDLGVSAFSSLTSILLVRWVSEPFYGFQTFVMFWMLISIIASGIGFYIFKTYDVAIRYSSLTIFSRLTKAVAVKTTIQGIIIATKLFGESIIRFEVNVLVLDMLFTIFLLIFLRNVIIYILNSSANSIENRIGKVRVMVYGVNPKAIATLTRLQESSYYDIIGFISANPAYNKLFIQEKEVYAYKDLQDLATLRNKLGFDGVLISGDHEESKLQELNNFCMELGLHVLNIPKIEDAKFGNLTQDAIKQISRESEYISDGMSSLGRNAKRAFDIAVSTVCLIVFSPLFLLVYIAIKLEDHGPAIYKQERIGRFGRPFYIYKFRSMKIDAEAAGPTLYSGEDDPRLTKVGKFIRTHHLDELPQLFNVFMGDMALVGWRPERQYYIDKIMEVDPRYYYLYQIRPGVTSYATLYNGYTDTLEKMLKRLEYDLFYLRNRSWGFDIKILFMTFMSIMFGKKF